MTTVPDNRVRALLQEERRESNGASSAQRERYATSPTNVTCCRRGRRDAER